MRTSDQLLARAILESSSHLGLYSDASGQDTRGTTLVDLGTNEQKVESITVHEVEPSGKDPLAEERAAHNARVEAKKAEKKARKAQRDWLAQIAKYNNPW